MAVSQVTELNQRTATHDKDKTEYVRTYAVITNSNSDDQTTVLASGSIPALFALHPNDSGAYVRTRTATEVEKLTTGGSAWTVAISYSDSTEDDEENPLDEPTIYNWGQVKRDIVAERDQANNAVVNSAGDPFHNPPAIRQKSLVQLQVTKNFSSFDGSLAINYVDRVNSAAFSGGAIGTVLCEGVSAQGPNVENDISFYTVTASFLYDPQGWQPRKILDQGFRFLDNGVVKPIEALGVPVSEPKLLDGQGGVLAVGGNPVFLEFNLYAEANFNSMGF